MPESEMELIANILRLRRMPTASSQIDLYPEGVSS